MRRNYRPRNRSRRLYEASGNGKTKVEQLEDIFDRKALGSVYYDEKHKFIEISDSSSTGEDVFIEASCKGPNDLSDLVDQCDYYANDFSVDDYFELFYDSMGDSLGVEGLIDGFESAKEIYQDWYKAVRGIK